MADTRLLAFKALKNWLNSEKYIDHIVDSLSGKITDRDKRFFDNLVNGTVMMHRQLDAIIQKFSRRNSRLHESVKILAWLGAYELLHQGASKNYATVHSIVNQAKKLTPRSSGYINAVLRKIIIFRENGEWDKFLKDSSISPGLRYSFPDWLILRWQQQFPEQWEDLLRTLNSEAPKMIYIFDPVHKDNIVKELVALDLQPEINPYHPAFVHVRSLQPLLSHEMLQSGKISIQDVSTIFPVKLLLAEVPERVTDVCAAPGGKLALMRSILPEAIPVAACDISDFRLNLVKKNMKRLNLDMVRYKESDASIDEYRASSHFLVDAPCSGFGVIRKRSDLRWRRKPGDVKDLKVLQLKILNNVYKSLLPGGRLVYSTCTFDREENMDVVEEFIKSHDDMSFAGVPGGFPKDLIIDNKAIATLPHLHFAEGSFAIALKKK